MKPKKSLGQNFLMHRRIAERIVDAAEIADTDTVLEIGPGTGMLTRVLLSRAAHVVAVEADGELIPQLQETFAAEIVEGRFTLIHDDIRHFDPATLDTYKLVANIPYYITGEIMRMFLSARVKPSSMTLLVQKEVAVRIARDKKESMLSIAVKTYGVPRYCFTVPRGAFRPAPNVDSAVLSITGIHTPFASEKEEQLFFEVMRTGFMHKRKQLAKNLELMRDADTVASALMNAGLAPKVRPEEVSVDGWRALTHSLSV